MKLDKDQVIAKLLPVLDFLRRYRAMIFIVGFLGAYGFLVIRINSLAQREPTPAAVDEKVSSSRLKIDQTSINKILQLEDQNVEVKSLFEQARNNPFSE
jgi:hypothetical protein